MTKVELLNSLKAALENGTLISEKHDPYELEKIYNTSRSVISYTIRDEIFEFISTGIDKVFEYSDTRQKKASKYYEIIPYDTFSIASSGVNAYSTKPHIALDRVVAVCGYKQGWHIFGEDSRKIKQKVVAQELSNMRELY